MTTSSEKVAAEILRHISKFEGVEISFILSGLALVLCRLSIIAEVEDEAAIEAFKFTLKMVHAHMSEEDKRTH
jgi:hypothetical protein